MRCEFFCVWKMGGFQYDALFHGIGVGGIC